MAEIECDEGFLKSKLILIQILFGFLQLVLGNTFPYAHYQNKAYFTRPQRGTQVRQLGLFLSKQFTHR